MSRNVHLRDIPLRKPAPTILATAENLLRDRRDEARSSLNVTNCATVGAAKIDVQMNRVCHACVGSMIQHPMERDRKYKSRWDAKRYVYEYYDNVKREWTTRFTYLTPTTKKNNYYPYRYLVGWSNHQLKPQYAGGDIRGTDPFKGETLRACQMYYDWLRNHSHFSRFFAGPRDVRTLTRFGYIVDLDAPSFVVHTIAVAWRMPGEYIELVEEWYHLVQRGVDPHLAFGVVQKVIGFTAGSEGILLDYSPRGHIFCDQASPTTIARFAEGIASIEKLSPGEQKYHHMMTPARMYYTTANLRAWETSTWGAEYGGWLDILTEERPELIIEKEVPNLWGGRPYVNRSVASGAFQRAYDPGFIWLLGKVGEVVRNWRR